jgi:hypothetical protein
MKFYGEELQPPSSVPMLFPDLMIAAYMKDVDLGFDAAGLAAFGLRAI